MFKDFKSLLNINWIYFFLLLIIFWIGEINLYSAAGGDWNPWAKNHLYRLMLGFFLMFSISYKYESLRFAISFTRVSAGNRTNASPI